MSISIIKPGLLGTIQDMGRYGYGSLGINCGGAMDRYAAQVANMLVGNDVREAVMELHFPGPQILFEQNALISITGANFTPTLNDEPLPLWQPILIRKNTILHFPKLQQGARCYIAIHAGFCIEQWLGSYSTNLKAGVGGFNGRKFEKGDELRSKENSLYFAGWMKEGRDVISLNWRADIASAYQYPHEIFFIEGNEFAHLTDTSAHDFLQSNFIIHPFSDRMGYQVKGPELALRENKELVSASVSFGTIQLLPNAELIILMADHQTTGGYPRIGHVITAHLPKLAQLQPSDCIQFKKITVDKAEELFFAQQKELAILQTACTDHLNDLACKQ
ncbi:MAG: biotin-dependent carboxyltransferase family protein [Chitinophagaceae bacterium]